MPEKGNRRGHCAVCGLEMGWYDSKWVEVNGDRLVGVYTDEHPNCAQSMGIDHRSKEWWYYTDG